METVFKKAKGIPIHMHNPNFENAQYIKLLINYLEVMKFDFLEHNSLSNYSYDDIIQKIQFLIENSPVMIECIKVCY